MNSFIELKKRKWYFPRQWEEVDAKKFWKFSEIALQKPPSVRRNTLLSLLYVPKNILSRFPDYAQKIVEVFNFVDEYQLFELPPFRQYQSRGDKLRICTLEEFATADTYYFYLSTSDQKDEFLNQLASILLRPPGKYEAARCEKNAKNISLPLYAKLAALHYFISSKIYLQQIFPEVLGDPQVKTEREIENPLPPSPPQAPRWNELISGLCDGSMAQLRRIQETPLYDALAFLQERHRTIARDQLEHPEKYFKKL